LQVEVSFGLDREDVLLDGELDRVRVDAGEVEVDVELVAAPVDVDWD
jgi:hypothetical protein